MEKDKKTLKELYAFICKEEGLKKLPVMYKKVGKGGACLKFWVDRLTGKKTPACIEIDLSRICCGAAWALCHEVAHQILINNKNYSAHGSGFKKEETRLINKYTSCEIAKRLIF